MRSVEFDDQTALKADVIDDVWSDGMLAAPPFAITPTPALSHWRGTGGLLRGFRRNGCFVIMFSPQRGRQERDVVGYGKSARGPVYPLFATTVAKHQVQCALPDADLPGRGLISMLAFASWM